MWEASKCNLCGDCLVKCRYANYSVDRAVAEIKLLMDGKNAEILDRCVTCMACNDYCPTGANPADLIFALQEKIGACPIFTYYKPVMEEYVKGLEGETDPAQWIQADPDKPVLSFDSFHFEQFPEGTLDSQLFKGLNVIRGGQYASLTGCVHMGKASLVERYGQVVLDRLAAFGKDIVYMHNEGFVLANVKAKEYGFNVPFKSMHLFEYLRNYLRDHKSRIIRLEKKVAYHANCATRWIPQYDSFLDEVFELIGVERLSRQYERSNALCCSVPVLFTNKELALDIQKKNFEDAIACDADAMITSCPVCDWVLRRPSAKFGLPKIFITDLCRMALGEKSWPEVSPQQ
jgi:Fe-S oxidoreductase